MHKFISASIWNFIANFSIRALSLLTYPFIVRNFTRGDISLFKAFQALIAILIATIPFGTKHLFISSPKNKKLERWNVAFYVSITISLIMILFVNIDKNLLLNLLGDKYKFLTNYTFTFIIILFTIKTLLLTSLMDKMDFKSISLALMIKQFIFYSAVIIFSLVPTISNILIIILILSEILELSLLIYFSIKTKIRFLPYKNIKLYLDNVSKKFILFMGGEQIFNVLALHFPSIFVIYVMGKNLAPEFQLPFYAINVPASLIMLSVAKVIFPYMSEIRDDRLMRKTFMSIEFVLTLILVPILIYISIFHNEIVSLIFEKSWINASFAIRFFPIMVFVNVLNNPFTSIAAIKEKPQIILIYSMSLFIFRMTAIYVGFSLYGFKGSILLFILADVVIRLVRLKIDLDLIGMKIIHFYENIKFNLMGGFLIAFSYIGLMLIMNNKFISASCSIVIWGAYIYFTEKSRIQNIVFKVFHR